MNDWILEVSQLNDYVADLLRDEPVLSSIRLRGEVSGFKVYPSGHWYFTLKDSACRIDCVMWRANAMRQTYRPQNGDQVVLHGTVGLYREYGRYQFVADGVRAEGTGNLYQRFEQLKKRLEGEGYFDAARKRTLPARPKKIAVVTSEAGAVLHDICHVAAGRDTSIPIVLVPAAVQGEGAGQQIAAAIRRAALIPNVDVIICGRGGGSMEELWCFNEECVAQAIYDSPVPVISAVGHETDFTIADFVADVRAATPSNAAEIAVPDQSEIIAAMKYLRRQLDSAMDNRMDRLQLRLMGAQRQLEEQQPDLRIRESIHRCAMVRESLTRLLTAQVNGAAAQTALLKVKLDHAAEQNLRTAENALHQKRTRLEAVSPMRVLERGYVLVTDENGVVSRAGMATNDMTLHFADGRVKVRPLRGEEDSCGCKEKAHL